MDYTERKVRLIDADLLKLGINKNDEIFCNPVRPLIIDLIDNMPTADAQEVKHGHWIIFRDDENSPYHMKCSCCGAYWSDPHHARFFDRCYKCGAIMDRGNE